MPQGNPTPPLVGGISQRDTILQGYVYQSGIHKPEHSSILTYKYPQYYMTTLLDRIGASEGIAQDTWSWDIMDRTRKGFTQSGAGTISTTTATITTDIAFADGYYVVGDVVRGETGKRGRITAIADASGDAQLTVVAEDGANWTTADVADGKVFGHAYNSFGEASDAPVGRLYLPTEDYNYLSILRRSFSISGSELTNRTYIGDGGAWYFTQEDLEMKEFARDREILVLTGQQYNAGNRKVSKGILDYAANGIQSTYGSSAGVSEADLQEHIRQMMVEGTSNEIFVLCGSNFISDVQKALKDYALNGAMSYGVLGNNTAGLDFVSYKYLGKTIHFAYYELFEDQAVFPTPSGSISGTVTDYSHFSLWLDLGTDSTGHKLISLKHKELNGVSRKFVHGYEVGMASPEGAQGGRVSSGKDAFTIHLLSEIGPEVRNSHRMGIMKANS